MILAGAFVCAELLGFVQANFAARDSWTELFGFLLLQPAQILLNLADAQWKFTRGMSDKDAVMLVTLVSLPLNCLLWYGVWRGWRAVSKSRRRKRRLSAAPSAAVSLHRRRPRVGSQPARVLAGSFLDSPSPEPASSSTQAVPAPLAPPPQGDAEASLTDRGAEVFLRE